MPEQWRRIEGTSYYVSRQGQVASLASGTWRVLKPAIASHGYLQIGIRKNGSALPRRIHTLVAEAFIGPKPSPQHEVNHKDGNKANNEANNLEWCTHRENINHSFDVLGRRRKQLGPKPRNRSLKLTEDQVIRIRQRLRAGESQTSIAKDYPVGQAHISDIALGKAWAWLLKGE